jgi:hypothetical protein
VRDQERNRDTELVLDDADGLAEVRIRCRRAAAAAHPDDLDVAALFADALMNLAPWALLVSEQVPVRLAPGANDTGDQPSACSSWAMVTIGSVISARASCIAFLAAQ